MTLLIDQMEQLITLFKPLCRETETMEELRSLLRDDREWIRAHYLSTRIHAKIIQAGKNNDLKGELQFSFEETCARTLHNLSYSKKPFDPDTPFWVIPLALKLAKVLGIDECQVLDIAMS